MRLELEDGIALAKELFAKMDKRGNKWKTRNVPIYIRENLWIPYYFTENSKAEKELFIIQLPEKTHEKVFFKKFQIHRE